MTGSSRSPSPRTRPSTLAVIGRYVLTPKIFDKLEQTQRGAGGEIQLTDAIEALMDEQSVYTYEFEGTRYDAGTTMGWLRASVELALQRPDSPPSSGRYLGRPTVRAWRVAGVRPARYGTMPSARRAAGRDRCATEAGSRLADIGTVLGGRYRLVELLGQGGMATIYRARDNQLERDVAVKVLRPEYGADPDFIDRFRQEAQSAASLNHPNVVAVYDYGTDPAGPFIVMELVDGEDLATIVRRTRAAAAAPGRRAPRRPGGPGARRRPRARHRPPRHQARQHPGRPATAG